MSEIDGFNYKQFNSNTLNKLGIKLENFDINKDRKIDDAELGNLLKAGKVSHVSQLLTKDTVSKKVAVLTNQIKSLKAKVNKYSIGGAITGGVLGLGAAGLAGTGAATTAIAATGVGAAVLGVGAAGYFITKAFVNGKIDDLEKELEVYNQTLSKM